MGGGCGHHLDRAAGEPELHLPERGKARPVKKIIEARDDDVAGPELFVKKIIEARDDDVAGPELFVKKSQRMPSCYAIAFSETGSVWRGVPRLMTGMLGWGRSQSRSPFTQTWAYPTPRMTRKIIISTNE